MADVGTVMAWAGPVSTIPSNWLVCDGRSLDRTNPRYTALFNAIGSSWGGDGVNAFNLPDLRGYFLRGVDAGASRDPDRDNRAACNLGGHIGNQVGSVQLDQFQDHSHAVTGNIAGSNHTHDADGGSDKWNCDPPSGYVVVQGPNSGSHGAETRPKNAYVHWIICFAANPVAQRRSPSRRSRVRQQAVPTATTKAKAT